MEVNTSLEVNNTEHNKVTVRVWKRYCCIPQRESNNPKKTPKLSFYKIPKNPELKKSDYKF